ncbi:MAG: hypothetical protein WC429_06260 [Verrucomicrobiia bacterium]
MKSTMKSNRILISKLDAARRQIETASKLFFSNSDFVSIHTLSYAAFTITKNLCDMTNNRASFTKWVHEHIDSSQHQQLFSAINAAGNFFKHADKDPDHIFEYIPDQFDILLILAVRQYEAITRELTLPMSVFKAWFLLKNPSWQPDEKLRNQILITKPDLDAMTKQEFYEFASKTYRNAEDKMLA